MSETTGFGRNMCLYATHYCEKERPDHQKALKEESKIKVAFTRDPFFYDYSVHLFFTITAYKVTLQAVAAVMNQLCVRFPMVAAHNPTSAFAVAYPESRLQDTRAALTALQAPLSIFNMSTGVKTHVLVFSRVQASGRGGTGVTNPLLPILKVRALFSIYAHDTLRACIIL